MKLLPGRALRQGIPKFLEKFLIEEAGVAKGARSNETEISLEAADFKR